MLRCMQNNKKKTKKRREINRTLCLCVNFVEKMPKMLLVLLICNLLLTIAANNSRADDLSIEAPYKNNHVAAYDNNNNNNNNNKEMLKNMHIAVVLVLNLNQPNAEHVLVDNVELEKEQHTNLQEKTKIVVGVVDIGETFTLFKHIKIPTIIQYYYTIMQENDIILRLKAFLQQFIPTTATKLRTILIIINMTTTTTETTTKILKQYINKCQTDEVAEILVQLIKNNNEMTYYVINLISMLNKSNNSLTTKAPTSASVASVAATRPLAKLFNNQFERNNILKKVPYSQRIKQHFHQQQLQTNNKQLSNKNNNNNTCKQQQQQQQQEKYDNIDDKQRQQYTIKTFHIQQRLIKQIAAYKQINRVTYFTCQFNTMLHQQHQQQQSTFNKQQQTEQFQNEEKFPYNYDEDDDEEQEEDSHDTADNYYNEEEEENDEREVLKQQVK